jgi:hypothetical protein
VVLEIKVLGVEAAVELAVIENRLVLLLVVTQLLL